MSSSRRGDHSRSRSHVTEELQVKLDKRLDIIEAPGRAQDIDDDDADGSLRFAKSFSISDSRPDTPNGAKGRSKRKGAASSSVAGATGDAADESDGEPLDYFMLEFASNLESDQCATLMDKVRRYEQRNNDMQDKLNDLRNALKKDVDIDVQSSSAATSRASSISRSGSFTPVRASSGMHTPVDSRMANVSHRRSFTPISMRHRLSGVEAAVQCSAGDLDCFQAEACTESSEKCITPEESSPETSHPEPVQNQPASRSASGSCCRPLFTFIPIALAFLIGSQIGRVAPVQTHPEGLAQNDASRARAVSSERPKGACIYDGSFLEALPDVDHANSSIATDSMPILEIDRKALQAAAAVEFAALQSCFQAELQEQEKSAESVSAQFEIERQQLIGDQKALQSQLQELSSQLQEQQISAAESEKACFATSSESKALQLKVQELEAAVAARALDFDAERKELHGSASLEQAALKSQCKEHLQEQKDIALESEKNCSSLLADCSRLQTQVQELEAASEARASAFEAEREQLRKSASLEKELVESQCQAQLQEQKDIAAESEKVCSSSSEKGRACQAQVLELQAAAAIHASDCEVKLEHVRANATFQQEATESACQVQLQQQKDLVVESEKLNTAASKESTSCQAQVRELEGVVANRVPELEAEIKQLKTDASLEQAASESQCLAQLQEQKQIAAESEKVCSASSTESAACLAQVRELEGAAISRVSDFEIERELLRRNASLEQAAAESRCQAQLQEQQDIAAENQKACSASSEENAACLTQVRELDAAAASRISDFEVEREQLQMNASLEQTATESRCQAQLQEQKDITAETEKVYSASLTEATACQAQVQGLEAAAATHISDFEVEREQLRSNASLEEAAKIQCQAQLQEQKSAAAEGERLLSASSKEGTACQAQVRELEEVAATRVAEFEAEREQLHQSASLQKAAAESLTSDFEVERQHLQKNASLERATTESNCQVQLQEQQDAAAQKEKKCSALQVELQRQEDAASEKVSEFEAELHDMARNCSELQSHLQVQLHEREESCANASAEMTAAAAQDTQALLARVDQQSEELNKTLHLLQAAENASTVERTAFQECSSRSENQLQMLKDLQTNASLEQAATETQLQAQLQELKDAARSEASNCPAKLEESGTDFSKICSVWAKSGKCESSPEIMHTVCKTSCKTGSFDKTLGTGWKLDPSMSTGCCCDYNEFCSEWAEQGMCESNAKLMLVKCQYSCGACGKK